MFDCAADASSSGLPFCTSIGGKAMIAPSARVLRITRSSFARIVRRTQNQKIKSGTIQQPRQDLGRGRRRDVCDYCFLLRTSAIETSAPVRCCTAYKTCDSVTLLALIPNSPSRKETSSAGRAKLSGRTGATLLV